MFRIGFTINKFNKFGFSFSKQGEEEVIFETKEDKDIRYEDEIFYFERELKKLQDDKFEKKQNYLSPDMSDHQIREVEIILQRINNFSMIEKQYFEYILRESFGKIDNAFPGMPNIFNLKKNPKFSFERIDDNPNWHKTQEIISILAPFIASGHFTGVPAAKVVQPTAEVAKEVAKPVVAEKKDAGEKLVGIFFNY
jgi:hypothetical protein